MTLKVIPFNIPYMTGKELWNIAQAHASCHHAGDGIFTKLCNQWLEQQTTCHKALLTHSCTAALEMAAILADIQPGDEVIMPSYTFVSTANAFVLKGAVPVFVDIRPDTLNLNETLIEAAITDKTRAIVPVHYAGVACNMDTILAIAENYGLLVIADAAQAITSTYKGRPLAGLGHISTLSFHETKNISCGEGGAILINDARFADRAEIIREKGTNRSQFFRGQVDKYTWVDLGSSYLPSDLIAAFLWAQIEESENITRRRLALWNKYHLGLEILEQANVLRRPVIPADCGHNAHMYYILLPNLEKRTALIGELKHHSIGAVFHYIPLHSSPAGIRYGRPFGKMTVTNSVSERLLRLPLWLGLEEHQDFVIQQIVDALLP